MDEMELVNRFRHHPPKGDQAERYHQLRASALLLSKLFNTLCPESRELHLAMTNLEQALMWASKAIAMNEGPVDVDEPEDGDALEEE